MWSIKWLDIVNKKKSMLDFLGYFKNEPTPKCPHCKETLKKKPSRKTKCPHCGEFMYVRTKPKSNTQVVVSKEDSEKIDEEWSIINGTYTEFITEKKEFAKEKENLKERFSGKEPSDDDVRWSILNKRILEIFKDTSIYSKVSSRDIEDVEKWEIVRKIAEYRSIKIKMAEILRRKGKLKQSLSIYLEICYLDLTGVDPSLPSGIADRMCKLIKKLDISKKEVKNLFIEIFSDLQPDSGVEKIWNKIEDELF